MITIETSRDHINQEWKNKTTAAKELKPLLPSLIKECSKVLKMHFLDAPLGNTKQLKKVYALSNDQQIQISDYGKKISDTYSKMTNEELNMLKKKMVCEDVRGLRKLILLENYLEKLGNKEITNGKLCKEKAVMKVAETFLYLNIAHNKQKDAFIKIFTEQLHLEFYNSDYAGKEKK